MLKINYVPILIGVIIFRIIVDRRVVWLVWIILRRRWIL
jgi:hypothetical protein